MPDTLVCPQCHATLAAVAPAGLCPRCLVAAAMQLEPPLSGADDPRFKPTTPSPGTAAFQPPAVEELAKLFPQWEITELLGKGGMGAVYKARQPDLDRWIAVKILPPEVGRDPSFAERFTREARALAKLSHPNIVGVYEFGRVEGLFFFVMEYVDGTNLRQTLQTGKLTSEIALAVVPQICDALQYAHDEGVVHRDIKPENILLDKKGRVKIADFGLSKLVHLADAPNVSLTGTHQVMGTFRYMAPEQMEASKTVDHRADIYSLGVVFYELLTGEVPMGRFAPPSKKAAIDVRLDDVVLRTLEREPQHRYQQAGDVREDLDKVAGGIGLRPPEKIERSPVAGSNVERNLERSATALFFCGLLMTTVGVLTVMWFAASLAAYALAPSSSSENGVTVTVTNTITAFHWFLAVTQFVAAAAGTTLMLAATAMRQLESRSLAVAGCWIAIAPVSPAWIVTLPVGLWALLVMLRPETIRAFEERERTGAAEPENWEGLEHLGLWGVTAAGIALVGVLATFLPWASFSIFGVRMIVFGQGSPQGIGSGVAFLIVFLAAIVVGYFRFPLLSMRLTMLAAGTAVVLTTGNIILSAGKPTVTQSAVSTSGDLSAADGEAMVKPLLNMFLGSLSDSTMFGVWIAFAAGIALLVTGCIPARRIAPVELPADHGEPRLSRLALVGAIWSPAVWLLWAGILAATVAYREANRQTSHRDHFLDLFATVGSITFLLIAAVGTTFMGVIAFQQIRRSQGKLYGLRVAFADAIFFPLVILGAVVFLLSNLLGFAIVRALDLQGQAAIGGPILLCGVAAIAACYLACRVIWRRMLLRQS